MSHYPDSFNPDLLARIPLDARTVLDVGCATGALGVAYRRFNSAARLLGIELDPAAATIAAQRLDDVAAVDVEASPMPFALPGGIDCIVYGDVLEHLREPWTLLRTHAACLSESGVMILCVPNVEHWSFAANLLQGTWDYQEQGLFDRTHLRWFSLETMRRGLTECGLVLCDVAPRIFGAADCDAFTRKIAPGLQALGVDPAAYAARAAPLQHVWRVRKTSRPRMTVAANMMAPVGGVSQVRVIDPLAAIATDPSVTTHLSPQLVRPGAAEEPRIFVLHRPVLAGADGLAVLQALRRDKWLVVTEFDDHPDFLPPMQQRPCYSFTGVHAVQTSTPALADVLRQRNPEIRVFPNAIRALPEIQNFADPNRMTLFFGALNRDTDWAPLMPALNAAAHALGERLAFHVVHDRAFFDALDTPMKQFTPLCDHGTYLNLLGGCELSLMPLLDTPFNRAKSDLKFIEAAACRVVSLASPVVYGASIKDGHTGLLFADAEALRLRLIRLVAMPAVARRIGDAALAYVAGHRMLAYQTGERVAWYRSLWHRRVELTTALEERLKRIEIAGVSPQTPPGPRPGLH